MECMKLSSSCCTEVNVHIDLRLVSHGISVVSSRKSIHLFCMMWNMDGIAVEPMRGNGLHLELTWGIPSYFAFLRCPCQQDRSPDFAEQSGGSNGHPRCNSGI